MQAMLTVWPGVESGSPATRAASFATLGVFTYRVSQKKTGISKNFKLL